jgi:hypothetical protein
MIFVADDVIIMDTLKRFVLTQREINKWIPKAKVNRPDSPLAILTPLSPSQTLSDLLTSPLPSASPGSPPVAAVPPMMLFELDSACWVPMGHQIEDGGPTTLPHTSYTPSEDLPSRYGNYIVAILEPPPSQAKEGVWHDLVHEFIQNHHHRAVDSTHAALFVLGLFLVKEHCCCRCSASSTSF